MGISSILAILFTLVFSIAFPIVIIALSHHSPRCWKRRRRKQGVGKAVWARIGD